MFIDWGLRASPDMVTVRLMPGVGCILGLRAKPVQRVVMTHVPSS